MSQLKRDDMFEIMIDVIKSAECLIIDMDTHDRDVMKRREKLLVRMHNVREKAEANI